MVKSGEGGVVGGEGGGLGVGGKFKVGSDSLLCPTVHPAQARELGRGYAERRERHLLPQVDICLGCELADLSLCLHEPEMVARSLYPEKSLSQAASPGSIPEGCPLKGTQQHTTQLCS